MEIEYYGGTCISVATKATRIMVNPADTGGKPVVLKDAVEIATNEALLNPESKATKVFEGPGEFEISDIAITGVAAGSVEGGFGPTHYRIEVADLRLAIVGDVSQKLNEVQLEGLGVIDVAFVPISEDNPSMSAAITKQLEPRLVVPLGDAAPIANELGVAVEETEKLKIKNAASLPAALSVAKLKPRK